MAVVVPLAHAWQAPPEPVEKLPTAQALQAEGPTVDPAADELPAPQKLHCVLDAAPQAATR